MKITIQSGSYDYVASLQQTTGTQVSYLPAQAETEVPDDFASVLTSAMSETIDAVQQTAAMADSMTQMAGAVSQAAMAGTLQQAVSISHMADAVQNALAANALLADNPAYNPTAYAAGTILNIVKTATGYVSRPVNETESAENQANLTQYGNVKGSAKAAGSTASASSTGTVSQTPYASVDADLDAIFTEASEKYGVDKQLLLAVAKAESNFHTDATSSAGAMGVMQLMPKTAEGIGVTDGYDPYQNIMGGAQILANHLQEYDGDLDLALAAYNAGSGNVKKYGGVPPFTETRNYITKIRQYLADPTLAAPGA